MSVMEGRNLKVVRGHVVSTGQRVHSTTYKGSSNRTEVVAIPEIWIKNSSGAFSHAIRRSILLTFVTCPHVDATVAMSPLRTLGHFANSCCGFTTLHVCAIAVHKDRKHAVFIITVPI